MINFINEQRAKYPRFCEIFRFLVVGGLATIIDMLIMAIVIYLPNTEIFNNNFLSVFSSGNQVAGWLVVVATAIGFIVGLVFNYVFSIFYVYDQDNSQAKTKKGFMLFAVLSAIGLFIQTIGMFVGYSILGINEWFVKVFLVILVLVFNYITRKIFIFNNKTKREEVVDENKEVNDSKNFLKSMVHFFKTKSVWINILFVVSSVCLCYLMYNPETFGEFKYSNWLPHIYAFATMVITSFYLFLVNSDVILKIKLKECPVKTIFAVIYALGIISTFTENSAAGFGDSLVFAVCASFAVFVYSYLLVTFIHYFFKLFWDAIGPTQKKIFIGFTIVGIAMTLITFLLTTIFFHPGDNYDVFLSFDTGWLLHNKYHVNQLNYESDIRHVFMSLCILPFAIIPNILTKLFFFIPAIDGLLLSLVQVVIMAYCIVVVLSLLKVENKTLLVLLAILFFVSAGTFYNMLTAEKFVFGLFYIVSTIYFTMRKSSLKWVFFIGSIGILTTNIFLLPVVLLCDDKPIKDRFAELVLAAVVFISMLFLTGQFNLLLFAMRSWDKVKHFAIVGTSGPVYNKFLQFVIFVANMFLTPEMVYSNSISQAPPEFNFMAIMGVIIILINILGFVLNHKNKFARVCFYWQIFMSFLLIVVGWGVMLNEMFIYTAMFTWTTLSLIYFFIEKCISSTKAKMIVVAVAIGMIAIYNIVEAFPIFEFAIKQYPGIRTYFN